MKSTNFLFSALMFVASQVLAQDYACMQNCTRQGADLNYCAGMCGAAPVRGGGMMDQPGLPRNPAFDQVKPNNPNPPLPTVADPKCMKDCQKRGYNYSFCYKKMCSYTPLGQ